MPFEHDVSTHDSTIVVTLRGELDAASAGELRDTIEVAVATGALERLVLDLSDLSYMASAGLRVLVFAKQKLGHGVELIIAGAQPAVAETIELTGFHQSASMVASFDLARG